jgi:hypothetical protein
MISRKRRLDALELQKEITDTLFKHDAGIFVLNVQNDDTILDNADVQKFLDDTIKDLQRLKKKANDVLV